MDLSPKTTCLERSHFYGQWGDPSRQVLLYSNLRGSKPKTGCSWLTIRRSYTRLMHCSLSSKSPQYVHISANSFSSSSWASRLVIGLEALSSSSPLVASSSSCGDGSSGRTFWQIYATNFVECTFLWKKSKLHGWKIFRTFRNDTRSLEQSLYTDDP